MIEQLKKLKKRYWMWRLEHLYKAKERLTQNFEMVYGEGSAEEYLRFAKLCNANDTGLD